MKPLRYYSEFYSTKGTRYRIEINTREGSGTKELVLSNSPFQVTYNDGNLFSPTVMSQAALNIITSKPLPELFTGANHAVEIRLKNLSADIIEWFGYITPNIYSGDYNTDNDMLALEAVDTIASLENIKYSYINGANTAFRTYMEILLYILDKADPDRVINEVYIQKTLRKSPAAHVNVFHELIVQEINFFDELDEPMNCQDVLKEMMKYLGMTLIQYQQSYYIIDHAFMSSDKSEFFVINRGSGTETVVTLPLIKKDLYRDIGVSQSGANLSIGDLYNKVSVRANLLNIKNAIPEIMDEADLVNQSANPHNYFTTFETIDKEPYTLLTAFFKSKENWNWLIPTNNQWQEVKEVTTDTINTILNGAWWQNVDYYKDSDGEPSSNNWKKYLTFWGKAPVAFTLEYQTPYLSLKKNPNLIFKGGYFIANLTYKMSAHPTAHDVLKTDGSKFEKTKYNDGYDNTWIPCRLCIGNYFYDGEKWTSYDEYNLKVERGYYKNVSGGGNTPGAKWYYYEDPYGYKRFVTRAEYDALPSSVIKKSGDATPNKMHSFTNENGERVFTTEEYYYECYLRDRFFLLHINKEGDKIFDVEKQLTNTVSYKMNLSESEDGIAIKLPENQILTGRLVFELFEPNHLGTRPNDATSGGSTYCNAFHISDIRLNYTTVRTSTNIFDPQSNDNDILYSNTIDDDNVKEGEDIELFINTYNGIAAYSTVITTNEGRYDFLEKLYSEVEGGAWKPEELLINKLCDHYEKKRYIYEGNLNRKFDYLTKIYEKTLDATLLVSSMSIDYANESCRAKLIEI